MRPQDIVVGESYRGTEMNIYEFMSDSPILEFFLALIVLAIIQVVFAFCINRPLRHANIRKHGWPPAHCDADGDFKDKDKD